MLKGRRGGPESIRREEAGVPGRTSRRGGTKLAIAGAALWLAVAIGAAAQKPPRKITLQAKKFEWVPAIVQVRAGETVELTLESLDVPHGLICRELSIPATTFEKGKPAKVIFTAEEPGTFRFKCSKYCGSAHHKMTGSIVVVP